MDDGYVVLILIIVSATLFAVSYNSHKILDSNAEIMERLDDIERRMILALYPVYEDEFFECLPPNCYNASMNASDEHTRGFESIGGLNLINESEDFEIVEVMFWLRK